MREVIIEKEVREQFTNIQRNYDFKREIGGIIIGKFDAHRMCLCITDISFHFGHDIGSRFRFFRNNEGHQKLMDEVWEQSNHIKAYLGEWHTHDQDNPSPSFVDKRSWLRISKRNNNFDQSCFIIVGHKEFRLWNIANGEIVEQKGIDYGKE